MTKINDLMKKYLVEDYEEEETEEEEAEREKSEARWGANAPLTLDILMKLFALKGWDIRKSGKELQMTYAEKKLKAILAPNTKRNMFGLGKSKGWVLTGTKKGKPFFQPFGDKVGSFKMAYMEIMDELFPGSQEYSFEDIE
jgi:hypothetical protein